MSFLNKLGIGIGAAAGAGAEIRRTMGSSGRPRTGGPVPGAAVGAARAPEPRESKRVSTGFKEFLSNLHGLCRRTRSDPGPACPPSFSFLIQRGISGSSHDHLH